MLRVLVFFSLLPLAASLRRFTAPCVHGAFDISGVCACYPGWTAADCSEPLLCPNDCNQGAL